MGTVKASVLFIALVCLLEPSFAYQPTYRRSPLTRQSLAANTNDDDPLPDFELPEEKAEKLRQQAEEIRRQAKELENSIQRKPRPTFVPKVATDDDGTGPPTLRNKRVLVAGANGRLGSMVCRYILRHHPEVKEVVALVCTVGEASSRGYGRLSYEVVRVM